jgi:hypothetical protein
MTKKRWWEDKLWELRAVGGSTHTDLVNFIKEIEDKAYYQGTVEGAREGIRHAYRIGLNKND